MQDDWNIMISSKGRSYKIVVISFCSTTRTSPQYQDTFCTCSCVYGALYLSAQGCLTARSFGGGALAERQLQGKAQTGSSRRGQRA